MEFGAEYLENSDMYSLIFGQDESFPPVQGQQKSLNNVLVEKFNDYGVDPTAEVGTNLEDVDFFDSEWMTSKIDLTCLNDQPDNSFNWVGDNNEIQSNATTICHSVGPEIHFPLTTLFADKTIIPDQLDKTDDVAISTNESASEEANAPSLEQNVPNLDLDIDEQFNVLLHSILAANKAISQKHSHLLNDPNVFIADPAAGTKMPLKRKLPDPVAESPKPKVKTPEQKQRKKLQNRNAATRYRSKKRSEQEILNAKCLELEDENAELREKVETKQQEIRYLKDLIIDVFSKKHTA